MESLIGISLFLGHVLKLAANIIIFIFACLGVYFLVNRMPTSGCTQNCNQGRNCTCGNNNGS